MLRVTQNYITKLKPNEVFVFGSNLSGRHGAGAAKQAMNWGAVYGEGDGLMGQTYAIPTKDENVDTLQLHIIKRYVDKFIEVVNARPDLTFLVTAIGCGLAGYKPGVMAFMFKKLLNAENVTLPGEFIIELLDLKDGDKCPHCENGILEHTEPDDPNSVYPTGGWGELLWCNNCDIKFEYNR